MDLKAIAVDLDGTLLNDKHKVSPENIEALNKMEQLGIEIIICTGRMPACVFPIENIIGTNSSVVAYNGAIAYGKKFNKANSGENNVKNDQNSTKENYENSNEKSIENSNEKSIENSKEKSIGNSKENSIENSKEKSIEYSNEKSIENSNENSNNFSKNFDKDRKILFENLMDENLVKEVIEFANLNGYNTNFYSDTKIYNTRKNESHERLINKYTKLTNAHFEIVENYDNLYGKKVAKLAVLVPKLEKDDFFKKSLSKFGEKLHIIKGDFFVEFLSKNINKAVALKAVLDHLKLDRNQVIAFGDGNNDVEMLKFVKIGICPKNGSKICRDSADFISEFSNNKNVVAEEIGSVIRNWFS